jgi:hypothetical protein
MTRQGHPTCLCEQALPPLYEEDNRSSYHQKGGVLYLPIQWQSPMTEIPRVFRELAEGPLEPSIGLPTASLRCESQIPPSNGTEPLGDKLHSPACYLIRPPVIRLMITG